MVWERIREIELEEAREKQKREAQAQADSIVREREAARRQAEEDRRRAEELETRHRIIREVRDKSGLWEGMKELERGLDGLVRKHAIVLNLERGTLTLVWGNKFKVTDEGEVTYERPLLSTLGQREYSFIQAKIDTEIQSVSIGYDSVKKDQWQANRTAMNDLLARAYRNPERVNDREIPPSKYSSGSSGSSITECCNS